MNGKGWFSKSIVDDRTTMLTEPFVHDYLRANIWHLRGRDVDLLVDTGMGICPLAPQIDTPAGQAAAGRRHPYPSRPCRLAA